MFGKTTKAILLSSTMLALTACGGGGGGSPSQVGESITAVSTTISTSLLSTKGTSQSQWTSSSELSSMLSKMESMGVTLSGMDKQATIAYSAYLTTGDQTALKAFLPTIETLITLEESVHTIVEANLVTLVNGDSNFKKEYAEYKAYMVVVKENGEKLLVKSEDEYTSPIVKIFKVENEFIVVTENSIYIVSSDINTKRIS